MMTHTLQLDTWDDQELHNLFAARLPVLPLPGKFAEQLTRVVFEELFQHIGYSEAEQTESTALTADDLFTAQHRHGISATLRE